MYDTIEGRILRDRGRDSEKETEGKREREDKDRRCSKDREKERGKWLNKVKITRERWL